MLSPVPIDDQHIERIKLRAAHKRGEHYVYVAECSECQADSDLLATTERRQDLVRELKRSDLAVQHQKAAYEAAAAERKALILEALELMSGSEIGRVLGVSRARVHQLRNA